MAEKKQDELLVPLENYLKSGIHLGTQVISSYMKRYVYKRRADGLAVINTKLIDERLKLGAEFLANYDEKGIVVVGKRESSWPALELFSKLTGIRVFSKKYPAGIITNPSLKGFFEPSLFIIIDPWLDKNALRDALKIRIPIMALCDTNNITNNIDFVFPCNNKSAKSIGLVFYVLAKLYCKKKKIKVKMPKIEEFAGEEVVEEAAEEAEKEEGKKEKKEERIIEKVSKKENKKGSGKRKIYKPNSS